MTRESIVEEFTALPEYRRHEAMRVACAEALEVWRRYRHDGKPLEYVDSVIGIRHTVDDGLPQRALAEVDAYLAGEYVDAKQSDADFTEPIVAMQDDDLDLPRPVAQAYYAIFNLHRIVFRLPHVPEDHVVLSQVASAVEVDVDDWVRDWWTRVWDAWASRPELAYAASPLPAAAFDALWAGNVAAALAVVDPAPSCMRAVLLAIAGRRHEAVAMAMTAIGACELELEQWLEAHVGTLVPEAFAMNAAATRYAVISGDRLGVREIGTGASIQSKPYPGRVLRFVGFDHDRPVVAGERIDPIGPWATFWDAADGGEVLGVRTLAALGADQVIVRHPSALIALTVHGRIVIDATTSASRGGAISPDAVIAVAIGDAAITIWNRDRRAHVELPGVATRAVVGGDRVLVMWAKGGASLIQAPGF
ncbi:MAG: hypothetical protein ABI867_37210 [Kofleriaceae bacterium]